MHKTRSMQSGVSGRSAVSTTSSARVTTRKRPSTHFHPFIIIAVVISIGILLAGLIMTVIAYWPGQSSIGYNPMRIAGPCVLGAGAVMLIVTIIVAVYMYKTNYYRRGGRRGRLGNPYLSQSYLRASRNTIDRGPPLTPTGRSMGPPLTPTGYHPQQTNGFFDQPQVPQHSVYKIQTMADPHNNMSSGGAELPAAVRMKSQRTPSDQDIRRTSLEQGRQSPMAGTPDIGYGEKRRSFSDDSDVEAGPFYDAAHQPYYDQPQFADQPLNYAADPAKKKKKKKKKPVEGEEGQEIDPVTGQAKKKKKKKTKVSEVESSPTLQRISIHAQPGTQVTVTPHHESTF